MTTQGHHGLLLAEAGDGVRYWRILILGTPGYFSGLQYWQLSELQFNGVLATGGVPLFSSELPPDFTADKAFDGILVSDVPWSTATSPPAAGEYIGYQFSSPIDVTSVAITARNHSSIAPVWTPTNFIVQKSTSGLSWEDVWDVSTSAFTQAQTKTFNKP